MQPSAYLDGGQSPGSAGSIVTADDTIQEINLGAGVDAVHYDFCEKPPATISGYVYQDGATIRSSTVLSTSDLAAIRDGLRTPDDHPIAGVTLILTDADGNPLLDTNGDPITTVTGANGYYQFTGSAPARTVCVSCSPAATSTGSTSPARPVAQPRTRAT